MQTQWNIGPNGPIGLIYQSLPLWLDLAQVPQAERAAVVDGVQVMERATLRHWQQAG